MKINLLLAVAFLSILVFAHIDEMTGYVGVTKRDNSLGCFCHNPTANDSVLVWIEGPDTVYTNDSIDYKLLIAGGAGGSGGFDLAVYFGVLNSVDTLTHVAFGELTHSMPQLFMNDTVTWNFLYLSPDSLLIDTFYTAGNSTNNDTIPNTFDQWNFGDNFIVHVVDRPVNTEEENSQPEDFALYQNYPNPFNPKTIIRYSINSKQFVTLRIYDVLGNEVATLVNEELSSGDYEVAFNPVLSIGYPASGIYLYQLKAGEFVQSKKMLLLK